MGSGLFTASKTSLWTEEEIEQNEKAKKLQLKATENVATYFFYGLPVTVKKQSHDPLSPIWVQADTSEIESRLKEQAANNDPYALKSPDDAKKTIEYSLSYSPTLVMVGYDGSIKIMFEKMEKSLEYMLYREERIEYNIINEDFFRPGSPFPPSPPYLDTCTRETLHIAWNLPEATGIAQLCELQYSKYDNEKDKDKGKGGDHSHDVNSTPSVKWITCASKRWEYANFTNFLLENLSPGMYYIFRVKYRNNLNWSEYSTPSKPLRTLSDVPSKPSPLIISKVFPDSIQMMWYPPKNNGESITSYRLLGKSVGDDEFVELYYGPGTGFFLTDLVPEFGYSFIIHAYNSIGESPASNMSSVNLPRRPGIKDDRIEPEMPHILMAEECREAWGEYFDQKTGKAFYFNKITGKRTLDQPKILIKNITPSELSQEDIKKKSEIEFRKKRFHLLRLLHSNQAGPGGGGGMNKILNIEVKRSRILWDTYDQIAGLSVPELRKRLKIQFVNEAGIDSGGLSKEFFLLISKEIQIYAGSLGLNVLCETNLGGIYFQSEEEIVRSNDVVPVPVPVPVNVDSSSSQEIQYKNAEDDNNNDNKNRDSNSNSNKLHDEHSGVFNKPTQCTPRDFFRFVGRIISKALYDRQLIDFPVSSPLLSRLLVSHILPSQGEGEFELFDPSPSNRDNLRKEVDTYLQELDDIDKALCTSLTWILNNDITDVIDETFSVISTSNMSTSSSSSSAFTHHSSSSSSSSSFSSGEGKIEEAGTIKKGSVVDLCLNGSKIEVTERNKLEYVLLKIQWRTTYSIIEFIEPLIEGFSELVPKNSLSGISGPQLNLMLNGRPEIDIEEIRAYTIYQGSGDFQESYYTIVWLWDILREFSLENRRQFLYFVTGSSRTPLDGYDPPFNLTQGSDMTEDSLPKAHTCFNQLVLPRYSSKEIMIDKMLFAFSNTEGFHLA